MRRFRKEFGLKKARILRERLIPVSQRLKIGINRHPLFKVGATGFEPATSRPPAERATKLRHTPFFNAQSL